MEMQEDILDRRFGRRIDDSICRQQRTRYSANHLIDFLNAPQYRTLIFGDASVSTKSESRLRFQSRRRGQSLSLHLNDGLSCRSARPFVETEVLALRGHA